jgi:quercetin dioxygenase-like cupin family protein
MSEEKDWPYSEEKGAKVVIKPWGKEIWMNYLDDEINEGEEKPYMFKKIYVNSGARLSLQSHVEKQEINYVIKGRLEAWFQSKEEGEIEIKEVGPGDIWEILPGRKHRLVALEDSIILECSTYHPDDVIRYEDDSGRMSGRIQEEH